MFYNLVYDLLMFWIITYSFETKVTLITVIEYTFLGEGSRRDVQILIETLGPVLYAIFISPLFDLEDLSAFADDNYTIKVRNNVQTGKIAIQSSLSTICKWMKDSGLRINESKTEALIRNLRTESVPTIQL